MGKALKRWWPLFMLPTCLAFMIGFVIPFIQGFYLSFCQFITINNAHFVGIENYVRALTDPQFSTSFFFTVAFAFLSTVLINVIALAIAQALTRKALKGTNIFRTIFFMPNLIGGIVLGYIWQILINCLLSNVGAQLIALNSAAGFWGLIILTLWQQVGYMMIIYIAGIQAVPEDMIEAAKIDGATKAQTLFKVIIPNVMPSITICTFLSLTNGFKLFDQNLALTGGLPYEQLADGKTINTTEMMALNIYNTFYSGTGASRGVAQAKAVIFFVLVAAMGLAQLSYTRKREVQQ